MNIYFLVEGRTTEPKVYPKFCDYFFDGKLERSRQLADVIDNNYYLLSANGYPQIFTSILKSSIEDINNHGKIDRLIICIDSEEGDIQTREQELSKYLDNYRKDGVVLDTNCQLHLIVQHRCIETWFLGNKRVYKSNPSREDYRKYQNHYNVQENDPEHMSKHPDFNTHADFHFDYLREMLKERSVNYTKKFPRDVAEPHYLKELIARASEGDISSFRNFYDLCMEIKEKL